MSRRRAGQLDELSAIALLEQAHRGALPRAVKVGIGDDAAVLALGAQRLVWTDDACHEGVHFERALLRWEDVGYRSFQAAVSDVGAMGARPLAALSALVLPRGTSPRELAAFGRGQAEAARECRCPVIGGNIARGPSWGVTTSVLGVLAGAPLLRSGARLGDALWLIGDVGLAATGLSLLQQPRRGGLAADRAAAVSAWRRPRARLAAGRRLSGVAHSAIDVSDGLARDAGHLASASSVAVVIERKRLLVALRPELARLAKTLGFDAVERALSGGEDYALLATGPARQRPRGARLIGRVERGRGVWLESEGSRRPVAGGFDHLR